MTSRNDRPSRLDEARLRQQAIGAKLRQMFEEVVSEPVPDDFLDILKAADERASTAAAVSGCAPEPTS